MMPLCFQGEGVATKDDALPLRGSETSQIGCQLMPSSPRNETNNFLGRLVGG